MNHIDTAVATATAVHSHAQDFDPHLFVICLAMAAIIGFGFLILDREPPTGGSI